MKRTGHILCLRLVFNHHAHQPGPELVLIQKLLLDPKSQSEPSNVCISAINTLRNNEYVLHIKPNMLCKLNPKNCPVPGIERKHDTRLGGSHAVGLDMELLRANRGDYVGLDDGSRAAIGREPATLLFLLHGAHDHVGRPQDEPLAVGQVRVCLSARPRIRVRTLESLIFADNHAKKLVRVA